MGAGKAIVVVIAAFGAMYLYGQYKEQENLASAPGSSGSGTAASRPIPDSPIERLKQTITKPIFQTTPKKKQVSRPYKSVPNLAKGGTPIPTKKTITRAPVQTVKKPIYVANKLLAPSCVVRPYSDTNYWYCTYPSRSAVKQGKWWKCRGLLAKDNKPGKVCRP